ncbi:MAG: hypothetical protein EP343_00135 [Deltaproteobacteria bacterium]|nr:MAG: hypothetical protein EP343_00135 [Deltaproteobacteria bacterium]
MNTVGEPQALHHSKGLAFVLLSFGFLLFSRELFLTSLDAIPGNVGDSRFNLFVLEHWFRSLQGQNHLLSPPMFYPVQGTLGYSDAMFLFSLPYCVLRFCSVGMFTAYQLTLYLAVALGLVSMWYLLNKKLGLSPVMAAFGALLALTSNVAYLSVGHTQLFAVNVIPCLVLCLWKYGSLLGSSRWSWRRIRYGLLAVVLLAALFLTSFYVAWFFLFFGLLFGLLFGITYVLNGGRESWSTGKNLVVQHGGEWALLGLAFVVASLPFLWIYLPVAKQMGARPYWHVHLMLPDALDIINLGPHNMTWSGLLQDVFPASMQKRLFQPERYKGIPPVTLVAFGAGGLLLLFRRRRFYSETNPLLHTALVSLFGTVLLVWLLLWKMTPTYALWKLVFSWVPGAGAIRAVFRFQHIVVIAVAVVVAFVGYHLLERSTHKWTVLLLYVFLACVGLEQVNTGKFHQVSKARQSARLNKVPPPPSGCDSFFAILQPKQPFYGLSIDAMFVANRWGIPTWNGYSGNSPKGYPIVSPSSYYKRALYWIHKHRKAFRRTCSLDVAKGIWKPCDVCNTVRLPQKGRK